MHQRVFPRHRGTGLLGHQKNDAGKCTRWPVGQ